MGKTKTAQKKGKTAKESSVIESKRKAIKPRKRRKAKRNCHKYKQEIDAEKQ